MGVRGTGVRPRRCPAQRCRHFFFTKVLIVLKKNKKQLFLELSVGVEHNILYVALNISFICTSSLVLRQHALPSEER